MLNFKPAGTIDVLLEDSKADKPATIVLRKLTHWEIINIGDSVNKNTAFGVVARKMLELSIVEIKNLTIGNKTITVDGFLDNASDKILDMISTKVTKMSNLSVKDKKK